jgi:ParB family chromosome partitioning protein
MPQEIVQIPIARVRPNPYQPRTRFSEEALTELAETIRQHGVLQPIVVRPEGGQFVLVAGERRLRAAERAGLETIPAVLRQLDERQMLELALVENLQREDINPVEAARAYQRLAEEFGLTHGEVAQRTGKSRAAVVNTLRLLQLPSDVLAEVEEGKLTEGHGRALLLLPTNADRREFGAHIIREGLSVREAEQVALRLSREGHGGSLETPAGARGAEPRTAGDARRPSAESRAADPLDGDLEERLRRRFGTKVEIQRKGDKGSIAMQFYSADDLIRLVELLGVEE